MNDRRILSIFYGKPTLLINLYGIQAHVLQLVGKQFTGKPDTAPLLKYVRHNYPPQHLNDELAIMRYHKRIQCGLIHRLDKYMSCSLFAKKTH